MKGCPGVRILLNRGGQSAKAEHQNENCEARKGAHGPKTIDHSGLCHPAFIGSLNFVAFQLPPNCLRKAAEGFGWRLPSQPEFSQQPVEVNRKNDALILLRCVNIDIIGSEPRHMAMQGYESSRNRDPSINGCSRLTSLLRGLPPYMQRCRDIVHCPYQTGHPVTPGRQFAYLNEENEASDKLSLIASLYP
jgi:hypothetical protein